jgi:2'-5' RNA ligase
MADEAVKVTPSKEVSDKEAGVKADGDSGRKDGKRGGRFHGNRSKGGYRDGGYRRGYRGGYRNRDHRETNGSGEAVPFEVNGKSEPSDPEVEVELPLDSSIRLTRETKDAMQAIGRASGVKVQLPSRFHRRKSESEAEADNNNKEMNQVIRISGRCTEEKLTLVQMTIKSLLTHVAAAPATTSLKDKHARRERRGREDKDWVEYTHFLSIPLNVPQVQEKLKDFKEQVLKGKDADHWPESLFQVPEKVHLTMGMLSLTDDDKKNKAKELLQESKASIIEKVPSQPIKFDIKGLGCFGEPKKTRVVFGKIAGDGLENVRTVTEFLADKFIQEGLLTREIRDGEPEGVRLHVTVMNNSFRERLERRGSKKDGKGYHKFNRVPRFIDVSEIFSSLEDFSFGSDLELKEIHISTLKGEPGADGFYVPLDVIKLA